MGGWIRRGEIVICKGTEMWNRGLCHPRISAAGLRFIPLRSNPIAVTFRYISGGGIRTLVMQVMSLPLEPLQSTPQSETG